LVNVREIVLRSVLFLASMSLHVRLIPWLAVLQLPTKPTLTPLVDGSTLNVSVFEESFGLVGTVRDKLNEPTTQPPGTVQFPSDGASPAAPPAAAWARKPRDWEFGTKGEWKARAGARTVSKGVHLILWRGEVVWP